MALKLGGDPWMLIILTFLEFLLILVPNYLSAKIEHTTFKIQILFILEGIKKPFIKKDGINIPYSLPFLLKIALGILCGGLLSFIGGYISLFFRILVENLFGPDFLEFGQQGAISTQVYQPNMVQFIILLLQQIFVIALSEEIFFRGFLILKLQKKISLKASIILSSVIFAFYHVPPFLVPFSTTITFFGYYFTLGLILSIIFISIQKPLILIILYHGFYNIFLMLF